MVQVYKEKPEIQPYWFTAIEGSYRAGDRFEVKVKYNWNSQQVARDYSVIVYSQQKIVIRDENGKTNMLHYDGQSPSGFKNSFYRIENSDWTPPDQKVSGLISLLEMTENDLPMFVDLLLQNVWVIASWFN